MKDTDFIPLIDVLEGLVRKACAHLDGNLDEEQIELYDLAFVQAELLAARTLIAEAERAEDLTAVCNYFCANAIVSITQKFSVRPQTFGLTSEELPSLQALQDFLAPQAIASLGQHYLEQGLTDSQLDEEKRIIRDSSEISPMMWSNRSLKKCIAKIYWCLRKYLNR